MPDFNDPRPAFVQIADDLRDQIKRGELEVGTRLPSQSGLAKQYEVAPNTLRTALKQLVDEGLISTQSTRGTFVLKTPGEPEPSPEFQMVMEQVRRLSERIEVLESRVEHLEGGHGDLAR